MNLKTDHAFQISSFTTVQIKFDQSLNIVALKLTHGYRRTSMFSTCVRMCRDDMQQEYLQLRKKSEPNARTQHIPKETSNASVTMSGISRISILFSRRRRKYRIGDQSSKKTLKASVVTS